MDALVEQLNADIRLQREAAYKQSMGIKSALYRVLPQRITKEDLRKQAPVDIPQFNIYLITENGTYGLNDVAELAALLKINITADDMDEMAAEQTIRKTYKIIIGEDYVQEFEEYRKRFARVASSVPLGRRK